MVKKEETKETQETEEVFYPTNDYCFKRLFGYKGNEAITQNLLEAILGRKCEVLEVKSDEVTEKDMSTDKVGVLDVYVKQTDGTQINIEMQVVEYNAIIERVLFYWAKKYIESIKGGDAYTTLKPTKVILIANFEVKRLKELKEIATSFEILDKKTGKVLLTEDLEIVIIDITKMKKYKTENKELENWLKFIQDPNKLGGDILDKNEAIKEAKKVYDELMADEHERTLIKLREKYIRDYNTIKEDGYNNGYNDGKDAGLTQGLERGQKQGEQKKTIEIAKKMLKENVDVDFIVKMTGLSKEELEKLKEGMN